MGIISTVVNAGKTLGRTGGNVVNTVKKYNQQKNDQVLKASEKSAILNKLNKPKKTPSPAQQNNRAKLKEMGFAPNPRQGQEKKQIMTGKKPIEFNPANKGAFAKPKAETKSAPAPVVKQKNQPNNLLKKNLNQKKMVEQAKQNIQQKQEKIHKNQSILKGWGSIGSEINDPKKRNAYIDDIKKVYGTKPTQQMADRLNEDSSLMNWPEKFVKDLTPEQQARRLKLMNTYGFSPKPQN